MGTRVQKMGNRDSKMRTRVPRGSLRSVDSIFCATLPCASFFIVQGENHILDISRLVEGVYVVGCVFLVFITREQP